MVIFIGVDPAFRDGGFYVCSIFGNLVEFIKMNSFLDFVRFIDSIADAGVECYICIENSNETNHTFISKHIKSAVAREKISRDVGKNQAVSQMAVDYSKYRIKFGTIYSVSPAEKGIKWTNKQFQISIKSLAQEIINYGKGNQDKRDAYKLALKAKYEYFLTRNKKK